MGKVKNILLSFGLALSLAGYVSYEFSGSQFFAAISIEVSGTQTEPGPGEIEERNHTEEHLTNYSPVAIGFFSIKKKKCHPGPCFVPGDYTSLIWTPPKHA